MSFAVTPFRRQTPAPSLMSSFFGYPSVIRSDGSTQFRSEFDNFCVSKNITHELISPYNPQSNGLAENAVKQAEHLLIKSLENNENFQEALSFYRNVPNQSGYSPAELLFGRRQKLPIPTLSEHHDPINIKVATANRDLLRERAKNLSPGDKVLVQDTDTRRWCCTGYITSVCPDNISFKIQLSTGQVILRGRRFLKPHPVPDISATPSSSAPSTPSLPSTTAQPSPPPAPSTHAVSHPRRNTRHQSASANMGGLFSFQKEEDPVITVKNVVGGDINDSSTHYQEHKEAATAAGITIGVIAVLSIMGCFWYYFQKARMDSAFTPIQMAAKKEMAVSIPMTPYPASFVSQPPPPPASAPPMYSALPTSVFVQSGPFPVCHQ